MFRKYGKREIITVSALAVLVAFTSVGCGTGTAGANLSAGPKLTAVFLDVGQGDAILLRVPDSGRGGERIVLVDTGTEDAALSRVIPCLEAQGVRRIDALVISHMHGDHAGGLFPILDRFDVGRAVLSGYFYSDADYLYFLNRLTPYSVPFYFPRRGESLDWGPDVRVQVLNPPEVFYTGSGSDDNLNSLVLRISYGGRSLLLAGDLEETAEVSVAREFGGHVDVLKVAHHGGSSSASEAFLKAFSPEISVISVGAGNDYGHPSHQTLGRLQRYSRIYRTDLNGTITLTTDGRDMCVQTER